MAEPESKAPQLFAGARRNWPKVVVFSCLVLFYWILVFAGLTLGQANLPLFQILSRSWALTGATLIGWALLSSLIFKWIPTTAQYWPYRRALGVAGFLFAAGHVTTVYWFYYHWRLDLIYFSFNPLINPMVLGTLAFPIFLVMTLTATDWAVARLGGQRWKNIQRLVYPAYFFTVFHFLLMVPDVASVWPGVVLVVTTVVVLLGQLYWWFKISLSKKFKSKGTIVGLVMIGLYLWFGFLLLRK